MDLRAAVGELLAQPRADATAAGDEDGFIQRGVHGLDTLARVLFGQ
jgi:predicted oxidoreductase